MVHSLAFWAEGVEDGNWNGFTWCHCQSASASASASFVLYYITKEETLIDANSIATARDSHIVIIHNIGPP